MACLLPADATVRQKLGAGNNMCLMIFCQVLAGKAFSQSLRADSTARIVPRDMLVETTALPWSGGSTVSALCVVYILQHAKWVTQGLCKQAACQQAANKVVACCKGLLQ